MNTDTRNRIVLPVVLPLLVLLGVAVVVGSIAVILLFTTRVLALTIAMLVAAGIMVAISLASSIDEEDMTLGRRTVILAAGVLPLVLGAGIALWSANGGVPAEDLMWNKQPVLSAPEGALVGAKNDQSFCLFSDPENQSADTCDDVDEVSFPAQEGNFLFLFNNVQPAIQHNFQIFELAGSADAPEAGTELFGVAEGSQLITGPAEILYNVEPETLVAGQQYYYNCIVHPVMDGVLTITEGGAEGEGGEGGEDA